MIDIVFPNICVKILMSVISKFESQILKIVIEINYVQSISSSEEV